MKVEINISVRYFMGPEEDIESEVNASALSFDRAYMELKGLEGLVEKDLKSEADAIPEDEAELD